MVKGIGGLKVFDSFHCEKTSFVAVAGFLGLIYFGYLAWVNNSFPTFQFPFIQEPITWLFAFAIIFLGGYAGVLYYRTAHHKCIFCKETLFFWSAKA